MHLVNHSRFGFLLDTEEEMEEMDEDEEERKREKSNFDRNGKRKKE